MQNIYSTLPRPPITGSEAKDAGGMVATALPQAPAFPITYTPSAGSTVQNGSITAEANAHQVASAQAAARRQLQHDVKRKLTNNARRSPQATFRGPAVARSPNAALQKFENDLQRYKLKSSLRLLRRVQPRLMQQAAALKPASAPTPQVAPTRSVAISPSSPVFQRRQQTRATMARGALRAVAVMTGNPVAELANLMVPPRPQRRPNYAMHPGSSGPVFA